MSRPDPSGRAPLEGAWNGVQLAVGVPAPVQQSAVTCGAACLVVARMSIDPRYGPLSLPAGSAEWRAWFAEQERRTMRRTNGWAVRGRRPWADLGWPRALGTSPWGARAELERGTGHPYGVRMLRWGSIPARTAAVDALIRDVTVDAPTLLYVGDPWLPRHVTLLTREDSDGDAGVVLYEPAAGLVLPPDPARLVARAAGLAGWDVPWLAVAHCGRAS